MEKGFNKRLLVVAVFLFVALGWGISATLSDDNDAGPNEPVASEEIEETISLDQVALHSTQSDCWLAIRGKVYDVTSFFTHPGGEAILEGCGTDATFLFENRPSGSGTPHSSIAEQALPNFYLGELSDQ